MAERHGFRFAALFTADARFQVLTGGASAIYGTLDQGTDAVHVNGLERIACKNLPVQIIAEERADIVATETERHLGQVVGSEREELRLLRHSVGKQSGARDLDHGS